MAHVFISYAHTDHVYARKLADYLLANGFDVWIDDRIDFGSRWVHSIFEAVDGCAAFIIIMTPRSNDSEFVEKEYLRAADQKKPTFPLLLEGGAFPYFVGIQYYDVSDGKLPEQAFLERLAKFAPSSSTAGQNVTPLTVVESKETPSPDATEDPLIASEPRSHQDDAPNPLLETEPPAAPIGRSPKRGSFLMAAGAVFVTAVVVIAVLVHPLGGTASTPTLTKITQNAGVTPSVPVGLTPAATSTTFDDAQGQIAFQSNRDGNMEIYRMDTDGSHLQRLTNNPVDDTFPAWSPDGSQIIFTSGANNNQTLYVMNADGSNPHPLGVDRVGWNASWSPDGTKITFTGYGINSQEIYVADIAGGNAQALTNDLTDDDNPRWSPDGTQIVFQSDRDGNREIYAMDADGSHVRRLTTNVADDINPVWSPDGAQIVFESNRDGSSHLYLMAADGSDPHLVSSVPGDSYNPDWSPDGAQIVFTSYRDSSTEEIYTMNADGSNVRRLTTDPSDDTYPAWRP